MHIIFVGYEAIIFEDSINIISFYQATELHPLHELPARNHRERGLETGGRHSQIQRVGREPFQRARRLLPHRPA